MDESRMYFFHIKNEPIVLQYSLNNLVIPKQKVINGLEVKLYSKTSFNMRVDQIRNKAFKKLYLMKQRYQQRLHDEDF